MVKMRLRKVASPPMNSSDDRHQFGYLLTLIGLVAARNRVLDAMRDVILQHFLLDAPERGADGRDLRHDIDAVPVLLHHAGEPADLTFNSRQPFGA